MHADAPVRAAAERKPYEVALAVLRDLVRETRGVEGIVFLKLFRSERRAKVRVALPHKTEDLDLVRLRNRIGRRSATALV